MEICFYGRTLSPAELYENWKSDFFMITVSNLFSQLLSENENNKRNQLLYNLLSRNELSQVAKVLFKRNFLFVNHDGLPEDLDFGCKVDACLAECKN